MNDRPSSYPVKIVLLFFIYYFTAELGLKMGAVSGFATLFWLPTGISLAAVLLFGYRVVPAIFLGAFFANTSNSAPYLVALGIALGNTLEAFVGAYLLRRFVKLHRSFERIRDVVGLIIIGGFLSTLFSATIGVMSLTLGGVLSASFISTWTAWWIGDMLSNLITAPFILVWSKFSYQKIVFNRIVESSFLILSVALVGIFVFHGLFGIEIKNSPLSYIVFPPLIWAALRFGPREVISAIFALSLLAVWGTVSGHGPFARDTISESLIFLQSFMAVIAITSMILAAAVAERRSLEKRKDDFISFASHELKTPITSIKAYTQLLERNLTQKRDKQQADYVKRMDEQLNRYITLINNMLDVTKMQSGSIDLAKEHFSLNNLIKECISSIKLEPSQIVFKKTKKDIIIFADRNRLAQVINNLISNAIKYSAPKKRIFITTAVQLRTITISIKDKGVGIAEEDQQKIFDRFYRVEDINTRSTSGLGIGLYLSKMIMNHHSGDLQVKSRKGKGSTFYLSLPKSQP